MKNIIMCLTFGWAFFSTMTASAQTITCKSDKISFSIDLKYMEIDVVRADKSFGHYSTSEASSNPVTQDGVQTCDGVYSGPRSFKRVQ